MGFESIIARIQTLPPFPESVIKLEEAFRKGEPDMKTIVSIIEGDPQLTTDILAKANVPVYGFKTRILSVMQAVTLFGLNTVRALALKASMERNFEIDMSPYGISNEQFSKISAMQNALMFQWYMGIDVTKAKVMIPLAFIMEIGKVLVSKELSESSYGEMFRESLQQSDSIAQVEEEFTGTTSARVSAQLFRHWYFEEIFSLLMDNADNTGEIEPQLQSMVDALNVIRTAVNVKEQLSDRSIAEGVKLIEAVGGDSVRFVNAARRVREKLNG
ncbi:MAG: HDOD domain-containing protein [Sulfuricurvum sp.]|nr:HDOD domain-containing protein [Sulfuricurvum sp.]